MGRVASQAALQQASLNQQSPYTALLQQQYAASQWAAQQLAAQGLKANPFANAIRTAVARLPLEWADFCEHVKDWSTDRLLSEVKRLRAERSAAE